MRSIIILTTHFPPPFSGAAVRVWHIVKLLSKFENIDKIFIVELSRNSMLPGNYFGKEKCLTAKDSLLHFIRIIGINDITFLKKIKPSLVISTLPPSTAIKLSLKIYRGVKIPVICDIQDITDEYKLAFSNKFLGILYRTYYANIYKALNNCARIYTVTEAMAHVIWLKTGIKPFIAYNGSDPSLFEKSYLKFKDKRSRAYPYVGVFVGSLNWEYQKLESIIKAIYLLKKDYQFIMKLRIIGHGALLGQYMDLVRKLRISDLIKFYGYVPLNALPDLLASSDFGIVGRPSTRNVWIMSSIRMTTYDYLSAGIPIIAYGPPLSYTKNFLMKYKVGIYIPSDNPKIIAEYIYNNIDRVLSIKKEYCRKIGEIYNWDKTLSTMIEYIKSLI